jgi:hypothetical protein
MKMTRPIVKSSIFNYLESKVTIGVTVCVATFVLLIISFNSIDNSGYSQIVPSNSSDRLIDDHSFSTGPDPQNMSLKQLIPHQEQINNTNKTPSNSSSNNISSSKNLNTIENATKIESLVPQVKITSHTKNQKVPAGTLAINGTSSDNSSKVCDVYVILNGIKPYQRVKPIGQDGHSNTTKEYSLWQFTFLPTYGLISEGDNKMTAKITCTNGSTNATKFNSLNVTGVFSNATDTKASISDTAVPMHEGNITTNGLSPPQNNSSYPVATYSPPKQQAELAHQTEGITPAPNYLGITPAAPLSNEIPMQNSSLVTAQQGNGFSIIESEGADSKQLDTINNKISVQTQKIVDKFIDKVQDTVEERLEDAIKMRTPFELVIPTPFETEDNEYLIEK